MPQQRHALLILPGFLESILVERNTGRVAWINAVEISQCAFAGLKLAPDGVTPAEPYGFPVQPDGTYPGLWESMVSILRTRLDPTLWSIDLRAWDWRLDLNQLGQTLAEEIWANRSTYYDYTIVGHSLGGVLARWIYYHLHQFGRTARIRKIIQIGSPNLGSFKMPLTFIGTEPVIGVIAAAKLATVAAYARAGRYTEITPELLVSPETIISIMATWPSTYYMLPHYPENPPPDEKAMLDGIYESSKWNYIGGISQSRLDYQRQVVHPLFRQGSTRPPPWKFGAIYGDAIPTANWLTFPWWNEFKAWVTYGTTGDRTVTKESATAVEGARANVPAVHSAQMYNPDIIRITGDWILEEWRPSPTPPVASAGPEMASGGAYWIPTAPAFPLCRGG